MGAIALLLGLSFGLAAPVSLVVLFYKSYQLERQRIERGGKAIYQESRALHPEALEEITDKAKVEELEYDRNFYVPPML